MKKQILIFIFCLPFFVFSQEKRVYIYGKVTDSIKAIKNTHIINLTTGKGTFTNNNGEFKIPVQLGDSLKISSIQYQTKIVFIGKLNVKTKQLNILLKPTVIVLDEVIVKNINLSGVLSLDSKKVPMNKKDSLLKNTMTFTKSELEDYLPDDYTDTKIRPPKVSTFHGIDFGFGVGASAFIPFRDSERLWALRRDIAHRNSFPIKLLSDFGLNFFFIDLKIPKEKYYHFLEYCNPLGIEQLYKNNKILELINILKQESKTYLKISKQKSHIKQ